MPSYNINQVFKEPVEVASREEIRRIQEERLLKMLPYAYENVPLIKAIWDKANVHPDQIRSLDDFIEKAPFYDKDFVRDFREQTGDPFGGTLAFPCEDATFITSSSGTTGDPTLFAYRWTQGLDRTEDPRDYWEESRAHYYAIYARDFWEMGVRPGEYIALLNFHIRSPVHRPVQEMGGIPLFFDHSPQELARFCEVARLFRPSLLFLLSNPLILGFETLERETGIDLKDVFSSFHTIVFGGEPLSPRARMLTERWGMKIRELSNLGDAGTVWECRAKDGMHYWEDAVLTEVLDPVTLKQVPDGGVGEMVVTSLVDSQMPFIRHRSGDLVRYTNQRCICGRTHGRLWVLGRMGDEIVVDGVTILPRDVWAAIETVEETTAGLFQIIRPKRELDELKLRIGYAGTPDMALLKARLIDVILNATGIRPVIELVANEELLKLGPPHKIPRTAKQ